MFSFRYRRRVSPVALFALLGVVACAHPYERLRPSKGAPLSTAFDRFDEPAADKAAPTPPSGSLGSYVAAALAAHPTLRARYHEWRAAAAEVAVARKLPEPTLTYGWFARSVETRVGPQNHRFSLGQSVPWPGVLRHAADAAAKRARAAERLFEAEALALQARVARAYWELWRARRQRDIHRQHRDLLSELGTAVRSRVEVGRASLADASQVDLAVSRVDDLISALAAVEAQQSAALVAAVGLERDDAGLPTTSEPGAPGAPGLTRAELLAAAADHPAAKHLDWLASAAESAGHSARSRALPALSVGFDYVQTGAAAAPATPDDGKDALVLSAGLSIPLWRASYAAAEKRERQRAGAHRARAAATRLDVRAHVDASLSRVIESGRRVVHIETTLSPQADAVYAAQVGSYATGDANLATVLIAQQQVLELRVARIEQRAAHEVAWAELQQFVGSAVVRAPVRDNPEGDDGRNR